MSTYSALPCYVLTCGVRASARAGLRQQPFDVLVDRARRDVQLRRDLLARQPLDDQRQHVGLAVGDPEGGEGGRHVPVAALAPGQPGTCLAQQ